MISSEGRGHIASTALCGLFRPCCCREMPVFEPFLSGERLCFLATSPHLLNFFSLILLCCSGSIYKKKEKERKKIKQTSRLALESSWKFISQAGHQRKWQPPQGLSFQCLGLITVESRGCWGGRGMWLPRAQPQVDVTSVTASPLGPPHPPGNPSDS